MKRRRCGKCRHRAGGTDLVEARKRGGWQDDAYTALAASAAAHLVEVTGRKPSRPAPTVVQVPATSRRQGGGRMMPRRNVLVVRTSDRDGGERATVLHETAHWARYALREQGEAGYHGEHDQDFYRLLGELHRWDGTDRAVARRVEGGCKGAYACPAGWP
jgi:hypothetical protein